MNSFNRLPVKAALAIGLIALGAAATAGARSESPSAQSLLERYEYTPGALACDVGNGADWNEMQQMVRNIR